LLTVAWSSSPLGRPSMRTTSSVFGVTLTTAMTRGRSARRSHSLRYTSALIFTSLSNTTSERWKPDFAWRCRRKFWKFEELRQVSAILRPATRKIICNKKLIGHLAKIVYHANRPQEITLFKKNENPVQQWQFQTLANYFATNYYKCVKALRNNNNSWCSYAAMPEWNFVRGRRSHASGLIPFLASS